MAVACCAPRRPQVQQSVFRHVSTNLHNLGEGKVGTLIGSAFVSEAGPVYLVAGLVALLAPGSCSGRVAGRW